MTAPTLMANYQGKLIPLVDVIRVSGSTISEAAIRYRVKFKGWSIERALTEPQVFGGKFPRSQEARQKLIGQILERRALGMSNSEIGIELGLPRSAIHGLTYRHFAGKLPRKKRPKIAIVPKIEMPTPLEMGREICWTSGCEEPRADRSKFCARHSFKPRSDQPMSHLMAARA